MGRTFAAFLVAALSLSGCATSPPSTIDAAAREASTEDAIVDAPADEACDPGEPILLSLLSCPTCLEGAWTVYGSVRGLSLGGASLEVEGCPGALVCRLGGVERRCFATSGSLRVNVDLSGYQALLFTSLDCERMTGRYVSEGGSPSAVRADRQPTQPDAGPVDACAPRRITPVIRGAPCGPCGARMVSVDGGAPACERLTNGCGGCAVGVTAPRSDCGPGHYYYCIDGNTVTCTTGDAAGLNACGLRGGPLSHAPGDPCGATIDCRYECDATQADVVCRCPASPDAGVEDGGG